MHQRDARFLAATEALAARYQNDDEAQLLHALALLNIGRGKRDVPKYLEAAGISKRAAAVTRSIRAPRTTGYTEWMTPGTPKATLIPPRVRLTKDRPRRRPTRST